MMAASISVFTNSARWNKFHLRRAVEISHYDIIKDINWYVRRGGGFSGVFDILPLDR